MGLFGALFAGVSGLGSQSNKIGIVSNNISNVNTVGFKQGGAAFNTLVVPSASSGTFSPGGVLGNNRQLVNQQGLIQGTTSVTDVAISGGGLFVVNSKSDGTGDTLYTRAGSFSQDASGNFVNAAGLFLQGLKVQTPALSVNPGNLSTININQNATGSSVATTQMNIGANFNAKQTALSGAGELATLASDSTNAANSASKIIIPTTGTSGNGLLRGDTFHVKTFGATTNDFVFTYGGFAVGRDVSSTSTLGDGGFQLVNNTVTAGFATHTGAATKTVAAINGLNVGGKGVGFDATTTGLFTPGTLTIDGTNVTITAGDTLNTIAANIKTALDTANGTATTTAQVTGSPGNYSIVVTDTGTGAGAGFNTSSVALTGTDTKTFTVSSAYPIDTTSTITVSMPTGGDEQYYTVGSTAYISGVTGTIGGVTAASINGQNLTVASIDTTNHTVTLKLPTGVTASSGATGGGTSISLTNRTFAFTGNMLDASSDTDAMISAVSSFSSDATNFTATVDGNSYNFTYNATPNTSVGQFNSLVTLVTAINTATDGKLTASLVNHQLYISGADADKAVTFTNGNATGTGTGASHLPGINWIQELGLRDIGASATGVKRFDTLGGLANQVNLVTPSGAVQATVNNPTGIATVNINAVDPQSTIQFQDDPANEGGSIIRAMGFTNASGGLLNVSNALTMTGGGTGYDSGVFSSKYDSSNESKNMSSGAIAAQFTKDITVYDSLGVNHTISLNVLKLSSNKWAVELTAIPHDDVISTTGATATDGKIAAGIVNFNGDGSLASLTGDLLLDSINVTWRHDANPSTIKLNLGTPNTTTGLTQFAGSSNVSKAEQNGSPTGQLTGVSIDSSGFVSATFSNGQTQKLYQIPLASVNNPNGLNAVSGNAYKQTLESGEVSLSIAGTNGTGSLSASALEQSNVDLSTQLTDLIVAQQAYGANTRVLTVTSQLLQQLNQIIQ